MECPACRTANPERAAFCKSCGQRLAAAPVKAAASSGRAGGGGYAGFWLRLVAFGVDAVVAYGLLVLSGLAMRFAYSMVLARVSFDAAGEGLGRFTTTYETARNVAWAAILWLYLALPEALASQGSLGKRLVKVRVTDRKGERVSVVRATFRNLLKPLSSLCCMAGYLMAGVTARRQALHDLLSGCLVLRR
jgi:uncharacterized RDD family membrane protein YckC